MHQSLSRFFVLVAAALVASLSLTGCSKSKSAPPPSGPPEVGIVVVKPEKVSLTTELSGRNVPQMIAEVRPQVSGIIQKRLFTEGSDVKAGQVLYQIDPAVTSLPSVNSRFWIMPLTWG